MAREVRVVEDGVEERPGVRRGASGPSWSWLTLGFVVGLSVAIFFMGADPEAPRDQDEAGGTSGSSAALPDPSGEEADPESVGSVEITGLAEAVGGFPDTLAAVSQGSASTLQLLTWPLEGEPIREPLAGFASRSVRFDAGGGMIALAAEVPGSEGMLLSMGVPRRIWPVATEVTGYAWHDAEVGVLAYTQVVDGELLLWRTDSSLEPDLVARGVGLGDHLAAWGTWGYAIQGDGRLSLLTGDGELRTVVAGRALDSDPSGWLVVAADDGLRLVSSGGGVNKVDADVGQLGSLEAGSLSPDRTRLAVAAPEGHMIIPLDGEGEPAVASVAIGVAQLRWSSDSRYLLSPSLNGIVVVDAESGGEPQRLLVNESFVAVATLPLTDR